MRWSVRLKRNEDYFQKKPYLDALNFVPYTLDNLSIEEIDCIPVLSERLNRSKYQIIHDGSLHTVFLGMSCHIPPLDNPVVRGAIQAGIDKQALVDAIQEPRGLRQLSNRFIPSRVPGFLWSMNHPLSDRMEAGRLLKKAGYSAEKKFPRLVLYFDSPRTDLSTIFQERSETSLVCWG